MLDAFEEFDALWRSDWGLSANEAIVITLLWESGIASVSDAARRTGLSSGGITALVDRLIRDGYVARQDDAGDRRRTLLRLTKEGVRTREALDDALVETAGRVDLGPASEAFHALTTVFRERSERVRANLGARADDTGDVAPL